MISRQAFDHISGHHHLPPEPPMAIGMVVRRYLCIFFSFFSFSNALIMLLYKRDLSWRRFEIFQYVSVKSLIRGVSGAL